MTEIEEFIAASDHKVIGLTGNAGAGKTSLSKLLVDLKYLNYSTDWRFVGDSEYRKKLLVDKARVSISSYIDACNQFNWWDWDAVYKDLSNLIRGGSVTFRAYDRDSGKSDNIRLQRVGRGIVYEGAILGPEIILNELDIIIFISVDQKTRFHRIMSKDFGRRSFSELLARFMITEYSESQYYKILISNYRDKMLFINSDGKFIPCPTMLYEKDLYVPLIIG